MDLDRLLETGLRREVHILIGQWNIALDTQSKTKLKLLIKEMIYLKKEKL